MRRSHHTTTRRRGAQATCAALLLGLTLLAGGCTPKVDLKPPSAFARFTKGNPNRWITADGVRMRARTVDNEPAATLAFWKEALARHLDRRGYLRKAERCFTTQAGLKGCTLDRMQPRGSEDWVLSVTLFVDGKDIHLVEVVGPWARWQSHEAKLRAAMANFVPRP